MEQGKNIFTVEYEIGRIKNYEKQILSAGYCEAFLPMSFVRVGAIEKTSYDRGGYKPIAEDCPNSSLEALNVLEKCVLALLLCREHLMDPRKMALNAETVFLSKSRAEVKLAYVPRKEPADRPVRVLTELIGQILERTEEEETRRYIKAVEEYIDSSSGSFYDVVSHIGELKQEIHICGWNH